MEKVGSAEVLRKVAKLVDCKIDEIKGYRVDSKGSAEVHTFDAYRVMKKQLESVEVDSLDRDTLDKLAHILTINTEKALPKLFRVVYKSLLMSNK